MNSHQFKIIYSEAKRVSDSILYLAETMGGPKGDNSILGVVNSYYKYCKLFLAALISLVLTVLSVHAVYTAVSTSSLIIAPGSLTKALSDTGFSPQRLAVEIKESIVEMRNRANPKHNLTSRNEEPAFPEITDSELSRLTLPIPGSESGFEVVVDEIRKFVGSHRWTISSSVREVDNNMFELAVTVERDGVFVKTVRSTFGVSDQSRKTAIDDVTLAAFAAIDPATSVLAMTKRSPEEALRRACELLENTDERNKPAMQRNSALVTAALAQLGNARESIAVAKKALDYEDNEISRFNLAWAYDRDGMYDAAIAGYQAVLEFNSEYVGAYYRLGGVYVSDTVGEYNRALIYYNKALELEPKSSAIHYGIGLAHLKLYRSSNERHARSNADMELDIAEFYFRRSHRLDTADSYPMLALGFVNYTRNKFANAQKYYESALKIDPDSSYAYSGLGDIYSYKRMPWKAAHLYLNAYTLNGDVSDYRNALNQYSSRDFRSFRERSFSDGAINFANIRRESLGDAAAARAQYLLNRGNRASLTCRNV